jgi:hypothetical protein
MLLFFAFESSVSSYGYEREEDVDTDDGRRR